MEQVRRHSVTFTIAPSFLAPFIHKERDAMEAYEFLSFVFLVTICIGTLHKKLIPNASCHHKPLPCSTICRLDCLHIAAHIHEGRGLQNRAQILPQGRERL